MKTKRARFCGNCKWGYFEPINWGFQFEDGGFCLASCTTKEPEINCDKIATVLFYKLHENELMSKADYLNCRRKNYIKVSSWKKINVAEKLNTDSEMYDLFLINYEWWVANSKNLVPIHENTVCEKHMWAKGNHFDLEPVKDVLIWLQEQQS